MLNSFDNYIFDLDGTLVNSSKEVLSCFKKAFIAAGYPVDESRFTSDVIGPPLRQIIALLAPELKDENIISSIIKNFRAIYDYDENDISVLYDGIYDFILDLKKGGKKLFIATFKPKIPTMRLIEKFFPDIFDDIYTIDKFGKQITKEDMIKDIISKYTLDKSKTVMIGDAASDVIAGKNAGVTAVGVLWGYGLDKTQLIQNADFSVSEVEKLKCLKLNYQII
ncbi:MAG: HAD hydrolase-like protein [Candidatus Gastranaerophilales bacterium]|nr:HAD hydrolase-like protein [Candidatus Gastranaerophilales bacterium]